MAKKRRDSAKKGNANRARSRTRISPDKKGTRLPPLPRGFKKSQCYFDHSIGRWVMKSTHPVPAHEEPDESAELLLRNIFEESAA